MALPPQGQDPSPGREAHGGRRNGGKEDLGTGGRDRAQISVAGQETWPFQALGSRELRDTAL